MKIVTIEATRVYDIYYVTLRDLINEQRDREKKINYTSSTFHTSQWALHYRVIYRFNI